MSYINLSSGRVLCMEGGSTAFEEGILNYSKHQAEY